MLNIYLLNVFIHQVLPRVRFCSSCWAAIFEKKKWHIPKVSLPFNTFTLEENPPLAHHLQLAKKSKYVVSSVSFMIKKKKKTCLNIILETVILLWRDLGWVRQSSYTLCYKSNVVECEIQERIIKHTDLCYSTFIFEVFDTYIS